MAEVFNDFEIEQGADWSQELNFTNPDGTPMILTGYGFEFVLAPCYESAASVITLTVGSGITVTPLTGIVVLAMTKAQTLLIEAGKYKYELNSILAGVTDRVLKGTLPVSPDLP
jgi:hypothetical protein